MFRESANVVWFSRPQSVRQGEKAPRVVEKILAPESEALVGRPRSLAIGSRPTEISPEHLTQDLTHPLHFVAFRIVLEPNSANRRGMGRERKTHFWQVPLDPVG